MPELYKEQIARLISQVPFMIDVDIQVGGRLPSLASSEFLTNKEQGEWAEKIVLTAVNEHLSEYLAVQYGHSETLAPGEEGFE